MNEWRIERTGWRDSELSKRHGCWGFNCPAIDLDFVMMEFNHGKPCALVEYKHKNAKTINPEHANYKALIDLANHKSGQLACLVAIYDPDDWSFVVIPLNDKAKSHYEHCAGERISEQRFVRSLHLLRKNVLNWQDELAIKQLNSEVS